MTETIHDDQPDRAASFQGAARQWRGVTLQPLSVGREEYFRRLRAEQSKGMPEDPSPVESSDEEDKPIDKHLIADTTILLWLLTHSMREIVMASTDPLSMLATVWEWSEKNFTQEDVIRGIIMIGQIVNEGNASIVEEISSDPSPGEKKSGRRSRAGKPGSYSKSQR